jgi:hypothetical protein
MPPYSILFHFPWLAGGTMGNHYGRCPHTSSSHKYTKIENSAKYVIVCCVRRTPVHQSLNVLEACLFAIKLLRLFPVGIARTWGYRKRIADKLSDICCEVFTAVDFKIVFFFVTTSCISWADTDYSEEHSSSIFRVACIFDSIQEGSMFLQNVVVRPQNYTVRNPEDYKLNWEIFIN